LSKYEPITTRRINLLTWFMERGYTPNKALRVMRPDLDENGRRLLLRAFHTKVNEDVWKEWALIKRKIKNTDNRNDGKTRWK
jgi:hypothetical protein